MVIDINQAESCTCGKNEFEFRKFANTWQLVCVNCDEVLVPSVNESIKRKMEIAVTNSVDEIKKFYPSKSKEIIKIKIELENMAFSIKNR